jgi:hypothetical protein
MKKPKRTDDELDHLVTRVIANEKSVDVLLTASTTLAGIIVLLKLTGGREFTWNTIQFSVEDYPLLIFSLLSVAHFFTAYRIVLSTHALWKANSPGHGRTAFREVTATGGIFVRELVPRVERRKNLWMYKVKLSDPSAWAAYGGALLLPFAIVPFDLSNLFRFYAFFAGALFITLLNWLIGSIWVVSLSELTQKYDEAWYHQRLEASHLRFSFQIDRYLVRLVGVSCRFLTGLVISIPLFAILGVLFITRTAGFLERFHGFLAIIGEIVYVIGILLIPLSIIGFFLLLIFIYLTALDGLSS